jgi:hypothetical protein
MQKLLSKKTYWLWYSEPISLNFGKKWTLCNSRFHHKSLEATLYVCKRKELRTPYFLKVIEVALPITFCQSSKILFSPFRKLE